MHRRRIRHQKPVVQTVNESKAVHQSCDDPNKRSAKRSGKKTRASEARHKVQKRKRKRSELLRKAIVIKRNT